MATTDEPLIATEKRVEKAAHIAQWCRENGVGPDQVERWTDGQWQAAADAIRVRAGYKTARMPSRGGKTREMVPEFLRLPPDSTTHPMMR